MKSAKRILVVTGVPGTGKTTFSNSLKKRLGDAEVIHVTDIVNRKRLYSTHDSDGAKIVKMQPLKRELERIIAKSKKGTIILESHLLCDMKLRGAEALVLREHLSTMEKRLKGRGYGIGKIKANLISEATDYCGIHAEYNYPCVLESFPNDRKLIGNTLKMLKGGRPHSKPIDLMPEFDRFLRFRKDLDL